MMTIASQYVEAYHDATLEEATLAFKLYPDNVLTNGHASIMFLRLSEEFFEVIRDYPKVLLNTNFISLAYPLKGPHIHIMKAFGTAIFMRDLAKRLKSQNPLTITFYRPDMERLHYLYGKEKKCHQH
jgi:hypothetical protein